MLLEQLYTFYESFNDWSHATLTPGKRWINISPVLTFEGWQIGSNFIHGQYLSIIFSSWELWILGISQQSWGNIGKLSFANLNPPQKKSRAKTSTSSERELEAPERESDRGAVLEGVVQNEVVLILKNWDSSWIKYSRSEVNCFNLECIHNMCDSQMVYWHDTFES